MPKKSDLALLLALLSACEGLIPKLDAYPFGATLLCATIVLVAGIRALADRAQRR
jgi:hypothetical protein